MKAYMMNNVKEIRGLLVPVLLALGPSLLLAGVMFLLNTVQGLAQVPTPGDCPAVAPTIECLTHQLGAHGIGATLLRLL